MATMTCCTGLHRAASSYRLISAHPSFTFQRFYVLKEACSKCKIRTQKWRGESPDGQLSGFFDIDQGAHAAWLRRVETEQARPEAKLMGDWSRKVANGDMDKQIAYQTKLCEAHKWYKGDRVDRKDYGF